jgi:DNA (cytosine-5)-methyltransferase 1
MLRAIQEIKPTYVIAENVFGITNIDGGLVFEQVCLDLEAEGYEVQPFIIPAAAKNAPHRRDRVWFVAYSNSNRRKTYGQGTNKREKYKQEGNTIRSESTTISKSPNVTDTDCRRLEGTKKIRWDSINVERKSESRIITNTMSIRLQQCKNGRKMGVGQEKVCGQRGKFTNGVKTNGKISNATNTNCNGFNQRNSNNEINTSKIRIDALCNIDQSDDDGNASDTSSTRGGKNNGQGKSRFYDKKSPSYNWDTFPTESPICGGDDGFPTKLDGITFSKWRNESIKGYGNAIVPQVAFEIFKALEKTT